MVWQQAALQQPAGATTRTGNTGRKQPVRFAAIKVEKSLFVTASRNALAKRSILSGVIKRVAAASSRSSICTCSPEAWLATFAVASRSLSAGSSTVSNPCSTICMSRSIGQFAHASECRSFC